MRESEKKYRITICNWDQYQREMRGGEKRKRRREWVAISSRIFSDPDFLRLTIEARYLWLMLVCYAGAVGPVFELSASDARLLFKLRRSADFSPLVEQGFIDLEAATNRTNRTNRTVRGQKAAAQPVDNSVKYPEGLNIDAWKKYISYRREMRFRSYKPKGAAQAMDKWAKYPGAVQMAAVDATIENGWQGVFPEKFNEKNKGRDSFDEKRARLAKQAESQ